MIAVVGVLNRFDVALDALEALAASSGIATLAAVDNGSDQPLAEEPRLPRRVTVFRNPENTGNWALFGQAASIARLLKAAPAEPVAVFHSDLFVWEPGWDARVEEAFRADPALGLVGFVGARGIARGGGRHVTMLNFQARRPGCSPAEWHGNRVSGLEPAACVDGCAMVFRAAGLEEFWSQDADWPPHHFYDKELSCRVLAGGRRVAVMGIACDHMGGQTASHERKYHDLARRWCLERAVAEHPDYPGNWDLAVYRESERRFLRRWQEEQAFLPVTVSPDWSVAHG